MEENLFMEANGRCFVSTLMSPASHGVAEIVCSELSAHCEAVIGGSRRILGSVHVGCGLKVVVTPTLVWACFANFGEDQAKSVVVIHSTGQFILERRTHSRVQEPRVAFWVLQGNSDKTLNIDCLFPVCSNWMNERANNANGNSNHYFKHF